MQLFRNDLSYWDLGRLVGMNRQLRFENLEQQGLWATVMVTSVDGAGGGDFKLRSSKQMLIRRSIDERLLRLATFVQTRRWFIQGRKNW